MSSFLHTLTSRLPALCPGSRAASAHPASQSEIIELQPLDTMAGRDTRAATAMATPMATATPKMPLPMTPEATPPTSPRLASKVDVASPAPGSVPTLDGLPPPSTPSAQGASGPAPCATAQPSAPTLSLHGRQRQAIDAMRLKLTAELTKDEASLKTSQAAMPWAYQLFCSRAGWALMPYGVAAAVFATLSWVPAVPTLVAGLAFLASRELAPHRPAPGLGDAAAIDSKKAGASRVQPSWLERQRQLRCLERKIATKRDEIALLQAARDEARRTGEAPREVLLRLSAEAIKKLTGERAKVRGQVGTGVQHPWLRYGCYGAALAVGAAVLLSAPTVPALIIAFGLFTACRMTLGANVSASLYWKQEQAALEAAIAVLREQRRSYEALERPPVLTRTADAGRRFVSTVRDSSQRALDTVAATLGQWAWAARAGSAIGALPAQGRRAAGALGATASRVGAAFEQLTHEGLDPDAPLLGPWGGRAGDTSRSPEPTQPKLAEARPVATDLAA